MKNPEKQWIKKVDAAMILVMRRCLRNYLLIFFGLKVVILQIPRSEFKISNMKNIYEASTFILMFLELKKNCEGGSNMCSTKEKRVCTASSRIVGSAPLLQTDKHGVIGTAL